MSNILLDTDVAIDFLRGKEMIRERVFDLLKNGLAFMSILTVYELYAGMMAREEEITSNFIQACKIEPISIEVAKKAGQFKLQYQQKGITLSTIDSLIGETARQKNYIVATNNKKHYPETTFWDD